MVPHEFWAAGLVEALLFAMAVAQCPTLTSTNGASAAVASGWEARLIATGLSRPRSILFDSSGNLLVVQSGRGIVNLAFNDGGGTCLSETVRTNVLSQSDLNHGIALSNDGNTLYASSSESAFSWSYDPASKSVTANTKRTIVSGMDNSGHTTRTLLISRKVPGTLIISRGSDGNLDPEATDISTGHCQLKAFDLSQSATQPYDFITSGRLLGWGLRNSVGIGEEPTTGGIYTVENSVDQITRDGTDVHQDNPGEELNFHGNLSSPTNQGGNYGYPDCFAVWNTNIPNPGSLTVGSQFTLTQSSTLNDTTCATERVSPILTFQAHQAPLDILFEPDGSQAYVSFHGSWNRADGVGYKVSAVAFANGTPVEVPDSKTATMDIFSNSDISRCPGSCFRPVGLARDAKGRIYVSSDSSGEIWVLSRAASASGGGGTATAKPSAAGTQPSGAGARQAGPGAVMTLWAVMVMYMLF